MKRLAALSCACALALACAPLAGADEGFGLKDLDLTFTKKDGSPSMLAGSHPYALNITLDANTAEEGGTQLPIEAVKDLTIEQPEGFVGDPTAVPRCPSAVFLASTPGSFGSPCPDETVLGKTAVTIGVLGPEEEVLSPVYNLPPPPGTLLKLGFLTTIVPVTLEVSLKRSYPYNPIVSAANIPQAVGFYASSTTVWGNPASAEHDRERGGCVENGNLCPVSIPERPFFTLPRSCAGPLLTAFEADSWQRPGAWLRYLIGTHDDSEPPSPLGTQACGKLGFAPRIDSQPTSDRAESPSGLDFRLDVEDPGLVNPAEEAQAQSDIKKAVVTLPEGMTANPSLAEGLLTCSEADLARETLDSAPGEGCPQASKVGEVEVETPLLEGALLKGRLFVADQERNPFGTLLALYMVIRDPELGILVKLPGKVEPDPRTGRLVTTFGEHPYEIPQFPFSHFRFRFREGGRSPLVTPPRCGTYETKAVFTPWADPAATFTRTASFQIVRGVDGAPCPPAGPPPFEPGFQAGSLNAAAGSHTPFYMHFTRRDGDQDMTRFDVSLPPGLTARLAGVARCSDAAIAAARASSGRAELASPSCPESAKIGEVAGGAGVGSQLTYVKGSLYLAGPFGGEPLSVVSIVPAVAGPFDVGDVVTRFALKIDPRSAEVTVEGGASDPLPHILAGIPLRVREVRALVDREDFTLNPTDCSPFAVGASIWGGGANVFSSLDDSPVARQARFQAADCASLGFKPRLTLRLKGGTRRGAFPRLHLLYRPRPGDANLRRLSLRFPHSEFIEQGHFRTICTRVQFAAGAGNGERCPAGSVYGHARVFTPLLDGPLSGPVFLRSSSHNLPDVVLALHGPPSLPIDLEVDTRIDSVHGGLRAIASGTPDAPVSRAVIDMQGGQKGLFVNSTGLCARRRRANLGLAAQNGARLSLRPVVHAAGCAKRKRHRRHSRR